MLGNRWRSRLAPYLPQPWLLLVFLLALGLALGNFDPPPIDLPLD